MSSNVNEAAVVKKSNPLKRWCAIIGCYLGAAGAFAYMLWTLASH